MKSPLIIRRVEGHSMAPTLAPGDLVLASPLKRILPGSVVLAKIDGREFIKRVESVDEERVRLQGDNYYHSHDSRQFGPVDKQQILGAVFGYPRNFNGLNRSTRKPA